MGRSVLIVVLRPTISDLSEHARAKPPHWYIGLEASIGAVRCVSMPSWELFDALPKAERDAVLPPSIRARLAVEAGVTQGWHRYIGDGGEVIGVDRFGASAPAETVLREYGFTVDNVYSRAKTLVA